ncbi:MAG: hypothetical protein HGA22_01400 [Clostridiales bacterium]|nr:hypothetical protein [Clostridiales bacterium]
MTGSGTDISIPASGLSWAPSVLKDGASGTFRAKVSNTGTVKAEQVKLEFYLNDSKLGEKTITTISAGSTASTYLTCTIPKGTIGECIYKVVADPANLIGETREDNNTAQVEVTVLDNRPNLAVEAEGITFSPAAFKSGDTLNLKAVVRNNGNAAAKDVYVRFSMGSTPAGDKKISAIQAGSSYTAALSWKVPAGISGEQSLKVTADPDARISELDEGDNSSFKIVTASALYVDLQFVQEKLKCSKSNPKPGETTVITAVLKNAGNTSAKNVLVQFKAGTTLIYTKTIATLGKAAVSTITCSYKVPAGTDGPVNIVITADPEGKIKESDETNNTAGIIISTSPLNIDLAADNETWTVKPVSVINAGTAFTVSGKVFNSGKDKSSPTDITFSLITYEPADKSTLDGANLEKELNSGDAAVGELKEGLLEGRLIYDILLEKKLALKDEKAASKPETKRIRTILGKKSLPALAAGAASSVSCQLGLPSDYKLDGAELEIEANEGGMTYEANRANNIKLLELETRPKSLDAGITDAGVTHTPSNKIIMAGQNITLKSLVHNYGTEVIKNIKVEYYINTKPQLEGATLLKSRTTSASINSGKDYTLTDTLTVPAAVTENQVVIVWLDPGNLIEESNEANNTAFHSVPVTALTKDISVEVLKPSVNNPEIGQSINWQVKITNFGNSTAGSFGVGFYWDESAGTPSQSIIVNSLAKGASTVRSFRWTVPAGLPYAINYPVRVKADFNDEVNETNEVNNTRTCGINIKAPDLSTTDTDLFFKSSGVYAGKFFRLSANIRNSDLLPVKSAKASLLYYIQGSASNTLTKLVDVELGAFNRGETKTVDIYSPALPAAVTTGTNVALVVVIDADGALFETDEMNNRAVKLVTVMEPPRQVIYPYIKAEVYDGDTGDRLNGATVVLEKTAGGTPETRVTGADTYYYSLGTAIFDNRPATASYKVTISAPGYRTISEQWEFNSSSDIDSNWSRYYYLDKKAVLSGKVTSDSTTGLSGVEVRVAGTDIGTVTDSSGNYSLVIYGGTYSIRFTRPGYARKIQEQVIQPLSKVTLNSVMPPTTNGYIEGMITTDTGEGLAGVTISNGSASLGTTASDGSFSLTLPAGSYNPVFTKDGYLGINMGGYTVSAGSADFLSFYMFKPSTDSRVEKGTGMFAWHQSVGTPAHSFFIPEYNVDVWWGLGRIKTGMDFSGSGTDTKVSKIDIWLKGLTWEAHKVEGSGDISGSGIDIPITIAAGGVSDYLTRMDVYKVALESNGVEVWCSEDLWSSADGAGNEYSKSFLIPAEYQNVQWDSNLCVKIWLRVQKRSAQFSDGLGSGALSGYYLDRKLIRWYPQRPVTTTVTSTAGQIWSYILDFVENPINAILSLTDLFTVEQTTNYTMEDLLPGF